jgi:hypothetical protein
MSDNIHTPFLEEIIERFKLPWKNLAFSLYLILILLGFGGFSIYLKIAEVIKSPEVDGYKVALDMATFGLAILTASIFDLNMSLKINSKPSLFIITIALCGLSVFLVYLSSTIQSYWALIPGFLGFIIALMVWILANADNENFSDSMYYEKMRGREVGHGQNW